LSYFQNFWDSEDGLLFWKTNLLAMSCNYVKEKLFVFRVQEQQSFFQETMQRGTAFAGL
jgi:hypothetical protein